MHGIRYASGTLGFGVSQKLLHDIPRSWCDTIRMKSRQGLLRDSYRRFSTARPCASAEAMTEAGAVQNSEKRDLSQGPDLADFIIANSAAKSQKLTFNTNVPYVKPAFGNYRKVYFDIYGCQMNVNDADVVWAILKKNGYLQTKDLDLADIVLMVTCAIRDGAEQKVWNRLDYLSDIKAKRLKKKDEYPMKIAILGCMAERLKSKIFDKNKLVDVIAGPDSYKDLPRLLSLTENTSKEAAINVILSFDETYADITPVRLDSESVSAFVTIMRGCDNMCTYCIVPFTRGRERSRPVSSILDEVRHLSDQGVKEVILLGQNVNSYRDLSESSVVMGEKPATNLAKGFKTVYKPKLGGMRFSHLLDKVSLINPEMRIRFTSPHPKDFPDEVLQMIAERPNICRQLHLPAQSGNSEVLERMRRGYTREAYLELVEHVRSIIPDVSLSSDFIAGFCGETEEQFEDTLTLMDQVMFNKAYLFAYSMREKTTAHRRYQDDVRPAVKKERLQRLIECWKMQSEALNRQQIGSHQLVLIEGSGRRLNGQFVGRNDGNTRVVIPNGSIPEAINTDRVRPINSGDYVVVQICNANANSLSGIPLYHSTIASHTPQMDTQPAK